MRADENPAATQDCATVYRNGPLEVDVERLQVSVDHTLIRLSHLTMMLLLHLVRCADNVLSREELREQIWRGQAHEKTLRAVDVLVCRLRARLGAAGHLIASVRSHGYCMRGGRTMPAQKGE